MIQSNEYIRDNSSKALINTNKQAFEEYQRMKKQMRKTSEMETDINNLKNDIQEIRDLLKCLVDRIK
jgi:conjugal transfer/entry exclusion protein